MVVPTPLGLFEMYIACCPKGRYPVFIEVPEVTVGPLVAVVVYEYSSVEPSLVYTEMVVPAGTVPET